MRFRVVAILAFVGLCRAQSQSPSATPSAAQITPAPSPQLNLIPTAVPTNVPTSLPTGSPTVPAPSGTCFSNLDDIAAIELGANVTVKRTYVLCPDTVFSIGFIDSNSDELAFIGGQHPIAPLPNVEYRCGADGSSANNCVLFDGSLHVVQAFFLTEIPNFIVMGLTFRECLDFNNVRTVNPGDITFIDCIFENNENMAPILLDAFPLQRRLDATDVKNVKDLRMKTSMWHEIQDRKPDFSRRRLQASLLSVRFQNCVFRGNTGSVPGDGVFPGLITVPQGAEVAVELDFCTFENNVYTSELQGYVLETGWRTSITNCCFINNDFVGNGIVQIYDLAPYVASNNFGGAMNDDGLICQFIVEFDAAGNNFICVEFDSQRCALEPSAAPTQSPTMVPSSAPTPSPTATPTVSPTQGPTMSPTKSAMPTAPMPTASPTVMPTASPTASPTTPMPTPSATPMPTASPTAMPTPSPTPMPTPSPPSAAEDICLRWSKSLALAVGVAVVAFVL